MSSGIMPGFQTDARSILERLQRSFQAIFDSFPVPIARPRDVYKSLEIGRKLGWKIARFSMTPDVFGAVEYIPGSSAIETICRAAERQGVGSELTDELEAAFRGLEDVVHRHAGDRINAAVISSEPSSITITS